MKVLKIESWKAKQGSEEITENIVTVLTALLSISSKDMPRGFQQALMFSRIIKSFNNKKELILDDVDYDFIKKLIETDTPAIWGSNSNIMKALNDFNSL